MVITNRNPHWKIYTTAIIAISNMRYITGGVYHIALTNIYGEPA